MRKIEQRFKLAAVALALIVVSNLQAQEQSVKPGINKNFENPSVENYIQMFENESRAIYGHREQILAALKLQPGDDIADVGAGTGFFSRIFAKEVTKDGTVYPVDIAKNFIEHNKKEAKKAKLKNIEPILCTERSVELPENSVDVVFICDTYHHFEYPVDTMASIHRALRPGGRLMIVDFERVKSISTDWTLDHVRCGKGVVTDEVKDAGFDFVEEIPLMEEQYVITFKKRG